MEEPGTLFISIVVIAVLIVLVFYYFRRELENRDRLMEVMRDTSEALRIYQKYHPKVSTVSGWDVPAGDSEYLDRNWPKQRPDKSTAPKAIPKRKSRTSTSLLVLLLSFLAFVGFWHNKVDALVHPGCTVVERILVSMIYVSLLTSYLLGLRKEK